MNSSGLDLRALIAEAVRDVVSELAREAVAPQGPPALAVEGEVHHESRVPGVEYVTAPALRTRVESVRIADDNDLDAFARQLLALFENPKNRQDLRAGRLRFHLDGRPSPDAPAGPALLVESGAVTERQVLAAHQAGKRIILGRKAVLTPLGREKARALGVPIQKER